ncbi:MAG: NADPH:quinone reductase [Planctomyces sp.]
MKAAFIRATGPASQIQYGTMSDPVPGETQVLIRTEAVSVNPIDTYIRAGNVRFDLPNPFVVGCDVCGVVEQCGPGSKRFKVGDRVWGSNQGLFGRQGTFSEYCAIDEQWLYPVPKGVSSELAAAGALVGITAQLGLFLHAGLTPGEVVFVNGGTGGVGSAVVQLAHAHGAKVITTAGTEEKASICRQLGADHVIQYRSENIDERFASILAETGPISVWFETQRMPTLDRSFSLMARRGRFIFMAGRDSRPEFPVGPFYVRDLRAIGFAMFNATAEEQRVSADALNQLLASGAFQPRISRVMSLSETAAAHQLQEESTLQGSGALSGKIVLKP